ncbi:MAG: hypothetical protein NTY81_03445 [Candidatus Staskawiczbacteria bacterium]|nr:hypothetical protein [Candidatus Staskawiczbacteria bacterium]
MSEINFKIGFWHPFGPHGYKENGEVESREEIIDRKEKEIKKNKGWTLWAFSEKRDETINQWRKEIGKNKRVFVLCSDSKTTKNPTGDCLYAKYLIENGKPQEISKKIKVSFFGKKESACAFKVKAVYKPEMIKIPNNIKWFKTTSGEWKDGSSPSFGGLPTISESLIKSGGKSKLRKVFLVLELEYPYVVKIKK